MKVQRERARRTFGCGGEGKIDRPEGEEEAGGANHLRWKKEEAADACSRRSAWKSTHWPLAAAYTESLSEL
jgi:hypothetical protein